MGGGFGGGGGLGGGLGGFGGFGGGFGGVWGGGTLLAAILEGWAVQAYCPRGLFLQSPRYPKPLRLQLAGYRTGVMWRSHSSFNWRTLPDYHFSELLFGDG